MKRFTFFLIIILMVLCGISAKPEMWFSVGFSTDRDSVTSNLKDVLRENQQLVDNDLYKKGDFESLGTIGPYYELLFFPVDSLKIGLYCSGTTSFIQSIDTNGYRSHNFDLKQNARIGIAYNQFISQNVGFFADIAFDYTIYKIAGSNKPNSNDVFISSYCEEKKIYCDFGYLSRIDNSYFKLGLFYEKPIFNANNDGWSLGLCLSVGAYF